MKNSTIMVQTVPLIFLILAGCAPAEKTMVAAIVSEKPQPSMALECHAEGREPFKPVKKVAGDKTPAAELAHALQSNKSRMARNDGRAEACECWIKDVLHNSDDMKRLEKKCTPAPVAAPVAASAPAAAPKVVTPKPAIPMPPMPPKPAN